MSLWGSALYFNASVTTSEGETIRFRDAVDHFFGSPIWKEFKETIKALFHEGWEKGWENMWSRFVQSLDPEGEQNAYQASLYLFFLVQSSGSKSQVIPAHLHVFL